MQYRLTRTNAHCDPGGDALRHKELVRLTFDTIRERYHAMPLPSQIAKILTAPREAILNRVCKIYNVRRRVQICITCLTSLHPAKSVYMHCLHHPARSWRALNTRKVASFVKCGFGLQALIGTAGCTSMADSCYNAGSLANQLFVHPRLRSRVSARSDTAYEQQCQGVPGFGNTTKEHLVRRAY